MKTPARLLLPLLLAAAGLVSAGSDEPTPAVREAILAGTWYPGDANALRKEIEGHLAAAPSGPGSEVRVHALVAPHAGYRWSGRIAGRAYATVKGRTYRRVIVLAPSHHVAFEGISIPEVTHYETPLGRVPLDREACAVLRARDGFTSRAEAHRREHSLEIQLPFLQVALGDFRLVPLVVGQPDRADHEALAAALRPLLDEHALLVVSSDFTHYGRRFRYVPFTDDVEDRLRRLDARIAQRILARDSEGLWTALDETRATVCGRRPLALLLHLLPPEATGLRLGYATSGEQTGDFSASVSYVALAFVSGAPYVLDEGERRTLLRLARATLEERFRVGKAPDLSDWPLTGDLLARRGVFVTLKKKGRLRGCIGFLTGRKPLAEAVVDNALNAAFRDPRFPPLEEEEVPDLTIEISVMTPLLRIADPLREIEIDRHGIVMEKAGRRGVFLPQVPVEQGWDLDAYLRNIGRKAGFRDPDAWRKDATFWTFEAIVFGEEEE